MPRPALTAEQKSGMRRHIRDAVLRIARRRQLEPNDVRGWEEITIRDVIKEAEISIGTFYKYFKDRSELGQFLWLEPVQGLKSAMQADFDQTENPDDKIRVLLEHYVRFSIENHRVFRGAFLFVRPEDQKPTETVPLKDDIFYTNLCTALEQGQDCKIFRSFEVHEMAQLFWAAIHGSLSLPANLDRYEFDNPEKIAANMIQELLSLVAVSKECKA